MLDLIWKYKYSSKVNVLDINNMYNRYFYNMHDMCNIF